MHGKKEKSHAFCVIFIGLVVLATFGLSLQSAVAQEGKITLKWWWGWEGDAPGLHKWVEERALSYEKEHPSVDVIPVQQTQTECKPAFRAAFAAKTGPDIETTWSGGQQLEDVWAGAYTPLSDFWSREDFENLLAWEFRTWNNKIWGADDYLSAKMLIYNKEFFKRAGLNPNQPPTNFRELVSTCEKLRAAGIVPIGVGLAEGYYGGWLHGLIGCQDMDSPADYLRAITGETSLASERYAKWWPKLFKLWEIGAFNRDGASLKFWQGWDLFPARKVAMILGQETLLASWVDKLGKDVVGVAELPVMGDGKVAGTLYVEPYGYGISSFSKQKVEAAEFLKHITNKEAANKLYSMVGMFPANKGLDRSLLKLDEVPQHEFAYQLYQQKKSTPWAELWNPVTLEVEGYGSCIQGIFTGEIKTPAEAVEFVQERLERWQRLNRRKIPYLQIWTEDLMKTRTQILDGIYGPKEK